MRMSLAVRNQIHWRNYVQLEWQLRSRRNINKTTSRM